jgi:hypothetical protein
MAELEEEKIIISKVHKYLISIVSKNAEFGMLKIKIATLKESLDELHKV